MKKKKIPLRKCIACNEQKPKKDLIRIVKNKENDIFIDFTGKANGRGAYICRNVECLKNVQKKKALNRAFNQQISEDVYADLIKELESCEK